MLKKIIRACGVALEDFRAFDCRPWQMFGKPWRLSLSRQVMLIVSVIALFAFARCTPPPPTIGCFDTSPAPSVRYGSLDLTPTVGIIPAGGTVKKTLYINKGSNPLTLSIDLPGTAPQEVFEICVKTSPPVVNQIRALQSLVAGKVIDPAGDQTWQMIFGALFVTPLQDATSNSAGIVKIDVSASQINSALANAPTNQGTEQLQFLLGTTYELDLTLVKP
jgi:hypothetical protein